MSYLSLYWQFSKPLESPPRRPRLASVADEPYLFIVSKNIHVLRPVDLGQVCLLCRQDERAEDRLYVQLMRVLRFRQCYVLQLVNFAQEQKTVHNGFSMTSGG